MHTTEISVCMHVVFLEYYFLLCMYVRVCMLCENIHTIGAMYIYMYIYIYIYIYMYIYTHTHTQTQTHTHTHILCITNTNVHTRKVTECVSECVSVRENLTYTLHTRTKKSTRAIVLRESRREPPAGVFLPGGWC